MSKTQQILCVEASAGSGKTYNLAKRYIKLLFEDNKINNIIAVTFANKAAIEMKKRVLNYLKEGALGLDNGAFFEDFKLSSKQISKRSFQILDEIMDYYDYFNMSTIDHFKNSILKSCAINLNISPNFKIEKKQDKYISFAVDAFLYEASKDKSLQKIAYDYIEQYLFLKKTSWFPKIDILNEMEKTFKKLSSESKELKVLNKTNYKQEFFVIAKKTYELINCFFKEARLLDINKSFFKSVEKLIEGGESSLYLFEDFKCLSKEQIPYNKGQKEYPSLDELWGEIRAGICSLAELDMRKGFEIYSILYSKIILEFNKKAKKDELIFLSELNKKTASLLNSDDYKIIIPEIYYRLSERYKHFLLDEFQDTDPVQWDGVKKFVDESLSNGGSLFYVGDPKQSIYDFRGAKSEIFAGVRAEFPYADFEKIFLQDNYRSLKLIVDFNNMIFSRENLDICLKECIEQDYKEILDIYVQSRQISKYKEDKGFVQVEVIAKIDKEQDNDDLIKEKLIDFVSEIKNRFDLNDIAVLCRTNMEASKAALWLMEKGFDTQSAQTLNLLNNNTIKQIISLIRFISSPIDNLSFASFIIGDIFERLSKISRDEMERFLFNLRKGGKNEILYRNFRDKYEDLWNKYFEEFFSKAGSIAVYELIASILEKFQIVQNFERDKAFIIRLLELIKDFEKEDAGIRNFLEYFDALDNFDDALFIKSASGKGIKVTTIHKAKGLQFPVVILPFASFANKNKPYLYFDDFGDGIEILQVSMQGAQFSPKIKELYEKERLKSWLSELNLLYVAMTRPEYELYMITPAENKASLLLGGKSFQIGNKEKYAKEQKEDMQDIFVDSVKAGYKEINLGAQERYKLNIEISNAQKKGAAIHFALSQIKSLKNKDIGDEIKSAASKTKRKFPFQDLFDIEDRLNKLLCVKEIAQIFNYEESAVFNEQEIVNVFGDASRADKIINLNNQVLVYDFKSSNSNAAKDKEQLNSYVNLLKEIYPQKEIEGFIIDINEAVIRA
ncbi:MAG: UvrD-helicase domain-containing protein [Elusimicrobiota bacterium]|jgi:ATP-dependent exoDNAse (exonuclease V) beta subunit|nr:UvrD-helicase domain-containing protein [Elusimicrobiota bacterium]